MAKKVQKEVKEDVKKIEEQVSGEEIHNLKFKKKDKFRGLRKGETL